MDKHELQRDAASLHELLETYSQVDPLAAQCLEMIRGQLAEAMKKRIHKPTRAVSLHYYFLEEGLGRHAGLWEAYARYSNRIEGRDVTEARRLDADFRSGSLTRESLSRDIQNQQAKHGGTFSRRVETIQRFLKRIARSLQ